MDSFFHDSGHYEMMQVFIPSVDPPSSPSVFFNILDHINSENDCHLPNNEDAVDLIKYLDCPEDSGQDTIPVREDVKGEVLPPSTPTLFKIHREEPISTMASISPSPLITGYCVGDWSSETANDWMPNLKREPYVFEEPVFSGWIPKSEIEEDEFTTGFDFGLYNPSKCLDMPDPEIEIAIATGNDSDVDIESVETATDASISTGMFDATVSSTSTASTSRSTKAKNKVVYTAPVISMPRPVGRPRGSKKKKQSARTGHTSTSQSASLPSCSRPEAENSPASNPVVLGLKLVKDDKTQSQPTYTQVPSTSITANFHDYALNPTASPPTTETARPTVVARRTYRRNTVDAVDKDKQNHHNELERNRRQKLADLFTDLRDEVPNISCNPKASKVFILREARSHILNLQKKRKLQEDEASRLSQSQKLLKIQLQQLQSKISGHVK